LIELKKWFGKEEYPLRAMGVSNLVGKNIGAIQFYDIDMPEPIHELVLDNIVSEVISAIFPDDCVIYRTTHGYHLVSFSVISVWEAKANAISVSRILCQDYWSEQKDLVLRISPKWKLKKFTKGREVVSHKPRYWLTKQVPQGRSAYSKNHLDLYKEFLGLPVRLYNKYLEFPMCKQELKIYHYKAGF